MSQTEGEKEILRCTVDSEYYDMALGVGEPLMAFYQLHRHGHYQFAHTIVKERVTKEREAEYQRRALAFKQWEAEAFPNARAQV